jgi:neutral ceramidase
MMVRSPVSTWIRLGVCILAAASVLVDGSFRPASATERVFRAGAAVSNITPPMGALLVGEWVPQPASHVHDQLWARCLVLDDGDTRLVIVVADNLGFCREVADAARQWIEQETGIPGAHVLLAATHTHSGPSARSARRLAADELNEYQRFLARRMADGVRTANNNLRPARIGFGSAQLPGDVFNRRWFMQPGDHLKNPFGGMDRVRMNPPQGSPALIKPAGPTDPEIAFLSLQTTEGQPLALLANYSLHYVGGIPAGHVSAGYFGEFADRIQQLLEADRLDPPFVGIMSNGTSGDINNRNHREGGQRHPPYGAMRAVADRAAQAVFQAHKDLEFHEWVPLAAEFDDVTLGVRKPSDELVEASRGVLLKPETEPVYHTHQRNYAERVLRQIEMPDQVAVPVQALRIGPLGITALPFEVFAETGLELKERSPLKPAFTISFANGSYAYLPTPEQHELGGYETWLGTSLVEEQASVKLVDRLLEMLQKLGGKGGW